MSTKQLKKMSPFNQQKSGIHPWTKEPLWEPHRKLVQSKQEESHLGKAPSSTQVVESVSAVLTTDLETALYFWGLTTAPHTRVTGRILTHVSCGWRAHKPQFQRGPRCGPWTPSSSSAVAQAPWENPELDNHPRTKEPLWMSRSPAEMFHHNVKGKK